MKRADHNLYIFYLLIVKGRRLDKNQIIDELRISNATFYRHLKKIDLFLADIEPGHIVAKCDITKLYYINNN